MKFIIMGDYTINLNKLISFHYSTSIVRYGKNVLTFELESGSLTSEYDNIEELKKDISKIEGLIGEENLVVLWKKSKFDNKELEEYKCVKIWIII